MAFVQDRDHRPCVLKIFHRKPPTSETSPSLAFLKHFEGTLCPHLYKHGERAVLLERILPGNSLKKRTQQGRDDEASQITADILFEIETKGPLSWLPSTPTIFDFKTTFQNALESPSRIISSGHVAKGAQIFEKLSQTQKLLILLHGDLHHDNVIQEGHKRWRVIDPKGVVGEISYEVGAFLRNPIDDLSFLLEASVLEKRLQIFSSKLEVSPKRLLAHGYSQAILASLWAEEDDLIDLSQRFLKVAEFLKSKKGSNEDF